MSRAVWLLLAAVLSLPALASAWTVATTSAFIVEFLSAGAWRPLSAITAEPDVRPLGGPAGAAGDLYVAPRLGLPAGLVLVHGIAARGKDDPLIQRGAALLARAGWAVAVPTVPGLTVLRLRPEDADAVVLAASALLDAGYHPAALLAISLGAGPAISAAAAPELVPHVSAILAVGGYASSRELLRYTLTGAFAFAGVSGRRAVSEAGIREFAAANRDLMGAEGRALVANRDPARVDALVAGLPGDTRSLLDALSPELAVTRVRAPLFLIHGRQDAVVPYTESLRLERAARTAGRRARVAVVGAVGHVDPAEQASWAELARCWAAFYAFRVTAAASR